ncbi:hypothetical protein HPB52_011223 [Rhipicephalus sanguineus]|uniref:HTH psq-type domain-containing protein n=1 Tax=Rhipicephalus sanguineus TaxID=34632 RepID=A0A9D4PZD1_RHISA|nr:hypothetical protein HPB52_011223 [Rhipicephalus sanguineus]
MSEPAKRAKEEVMRQFDVKRSTLSTYVKNEAQIMEEFEGEKFHTRRKRLRTAAHPQLEEALLQWIVTAHESKLPTYMPASREVRSTNEHRFLQGIGEMDEASDEDPCDELCPAPSDEAAPTAVAKLLCNGSAGFCHSPVEARDCFGNSPFHSEQGLAEERLAMVEERRLIDEARRQLEQEQEKKMRLDQQVILNKGRVRPKLSFSLKPTV